MAFNVTFLYRCSTRARGLHLLARLFVQLLLLLLLLLLQYAWCCTGGFVHPFGSPFPLSSRLKKGVAKKQAGFKGGGGVRPFWFFPQLMNAESEQLYKSRCVFQSFWNKTKNCNLIWLTLLLLYFFDKRFCVWREIGLSNKWFLLKRKNVNDNCVMNLKWKKNCKNKVIFKVLTTTLFQ
jgi:hypothetical protein